jgi:predicted nucleotidyltransferase
MTSESHLLRAALANVAGIQVAFVFGSMARGDARPDSDIDVCVIGSTVDRRRLARAAIEIGVLLGREVNVIDFAPEEWVAEAGDRFVSRVLAEPKEWVYGTAADLPRRVARDIAP